MVDGKGAKTERKIQSPVPEQKKHKDDEPGMEGEGARGKLRGGMGWNLVAKRDNPDEGDIGGEGGVDVTGYLPCRITGV